MRSFRHWLLILLAIWIPFQSLAALAYASPAKMTDHASAEAVDHRMVADDARTANHDCCDQSEPASRQSHCDCDEGCANAHGNALLPSAVLAFPSGGPSYASPESRTPASQRPPVPDRPPIAA